ncbi:hypothetical protein BJ165DRAFT_324831 [Panaeolus papilionaceus]|nr:hypothetical protein BJ165DRAFT_324831 [Panaeolus papilionaceus]
MEGAVSPAHLLDLARRAEDPRKRFGKRPSEIPSQVFWVKHYRLLMKRGYRLHDKFAPDWIPPWELDPRVHPLNCVESIPVGSSFLDAIRMSDGLRVMIKKVKTEKMELPIMMYLATPALRNDPRNHSVPLLDAIPVPGDDSIVLAVMPLLMDLNKLPFRRVGEVVEVFERLFETVEFLHEHNIVHMDACKGNVMMDAAPLIPSGWHPWKPLTQDGLNKTIQWVDRWPKRPNKYYLIDYDLSCRVEIKEHAWYSGNWGQDKTVPEMSLTKYSNGFKVDVYQMGNSLNHYIETYADLRLLQPIADALTVKDPSRRPNAKQATRLIRKFIECVPKREMERRIWRSDEFAPSPKKRFLIQYCGHRSLF